jgi:riboflavin synthase
MFTGIITDIGTIARAETRAGDDLLLEVHAPGTPDGIALGASIAHGGVCLTVIDRGSRDGGAWWTVQVSGETLAKTTMSALKPGSTVNLERSLKVGDEIGGHMVSGHVDGLGVVVSVTPEDGSHRLVFEVPADLVSLIAPKGSVTVDGVSLTVNAVDGARFGVNIIPHTWAVTTLGGLRPGDRVNIEVDTMARYVARILDHQLALRSAAGAVRGS